MTAKFLDNQIRTFKILLSWRSPRKKEQRFRRFSSLEVYPQGPPSKSENYTFIVVSPSLSFFVDLKSNFGRIDS